jgi:hypothetical protein
MLGVKVRRIRGAQDHGLMLGYGEKFIVELKNATLTNIKGQIFRLPAVRANAQESSTVHNQSDYAGQ